MGRKREIRKSEVGPHVRARESQPADWRALADRLAKSTEPNLLSAEDVAALLGLKRGKAFSLMNTGHLPAIRIGTALRIQATDLEKWLRQDRATSLLRDRRLRSDRERSD